MIRRRHRIYFFVAGLWIALVLSGVLVVGQNSLIAATSTIPVVEHNGASVPDFTQITFSNLPPLEGEGRFEAPAEMKISSFSWSSGDRVADVVPVGTFPEDILPLNLATISEMGGIDLSTTALQAFFPMELQTLTTLVESIPSLEGFRIEQVPPVETLLRELVGNVDVSQTIGNLLNQASHLGDLAFVDAPASLAHVIDSIPNLTQTPLQEIFEASESPISGIPGLEDASFSDVFRSILIPPTGEVAGLLDIVFSPAESNRDRPVSGSTQQPNAPCDQGCAHVELSSVNDNSALRGRQWMSGKYQKVDGGFGVLKNALSYDGSPGMEPTGRHPFGDVFKVVLWETNESEGSSNVSLFFRICKRGLPDLGCTPYGVGPIPIMTVRETEPIYLGFMELGISEPSTLTSDAQAWLAEHHSRAFSAPTAQSQAIRSTSNTTVSRTNALRNGSRRSDQIHQGIDIQQLSQSLSQSEQKDYESISQITCNNQGGCSRSLGVGLRSDDPFVREAVLAKPGGEQFLSDIDQGLTVSSPRLLEYLPRDEQDQLRNAEMRSLIDTVSSQINPTTGETYGQGSIEQTIVRTTEIYFGGVGAVPGSDLLKASATQVLQDYSSNIRN